MSDKEKEKRIAQQLEQAREAARRKELPEEKVRRETKDFSRGGAKEAERRRPTGSTGPKDEK